MSILTAALNAASLALIDSGFPMRSPIFASEFYSSGNGVNTFPQDRAEVVCIIGRMGYALTYARSTSQPWW